MKARSVIFFAGEEQMAEVKRRIDDEVLPRFSQVPAFLGFVALQSEGSRPEVVAMSFWDDGLEDSEAISEEFRDQIERMTGAALARREFTIMRMMMRGSEGEVSVDLPSSGDGEDPMPERPSTGRQSIGRGATAESRAVLPDLQRKVQKATQRHVHAGLGRSATGRVAHERRLTRFRSWRSRPKSVFGIWAGQEAKTAALIAFIFRNEDFRAQGYLMRHARVLPSGSLLMRGSDKIALQCGRHAQDEKVRPSNVVGPRDASERNGE
jgi:hypothetical protein